jgi:hypothetical protein
MNRCLFLLLGECFRSEGQPCSRRRDDDYGFIHQKESTDSHLKLVNKLENMNYKVDISINTYDTRFKEDLLNWYGNNVIYSNFTTDIYKEFDEVVDKGIKIITSNVNIEPYEFIFICRLDILLKDPLIDIFNPKVTTITYPNMMSWVPPYEPCLSPVFCIIPKKYFFPFDKWDGLMNNGNIILTHHSMRDIALKGLTYDDIDFMSNKLYIGNTFQSWNPLYKINCRSEPTDLREDIKGLVYVHKLRKIIKEEEYNI